MSFITFILSHKIQLITSYWYFQALATKSSRTGPNGLLLTKFTTSLHVPVCNWKKEGMGIRLQSQLLFPSLAISAGQRKWGKKTGRGWRQHTTLQLPPFSHYLPPQALSQPSPHQIRVSLCGPMQVQTQDPSCFGFWRARITGMEEYHTWLQFS